jgi:hypothetical protein
MGMDLVNTVGDKLRFSSSGWGFYLDVAQEYGWKPAGTLAPETYKEPLSWQGDYESNVGQLVSRTDAQALADALERALVDPRRPERERKVAELREATPEVAGHTAKLAADDSAFLREIVAFFRKGEFRIM